MIIDCAVYEQGLRRDERLAPADAFLASRKEGVFVWIGLHEPSADEFESLSEAFNLHPLAVEDAIAAHQRPKVEAYDDTMFAVFKTAYYDDASETVEFGEIQLFVGEGFVVSVRHGRASGLAEVRKRLEGDKDMLKFGPAAVLHAIADKVVDDYMPVLDGVDNDIGEIEAEVFSPGRRTNPGERIFKLKREVLDLNRHTKPLLEGLERLERCEVPGGHVELGTYFRDVHDHLLRVVAEVENMRDLLTDALNANLAQVSVRQNDDMRTISAYVAIGGVPTVVGAIYGMNFEHMPELHSRFGYPLTLVFTALACYALYRNFKHRGWL